MFDIKLRHHMFGSFSARSNGEMKVVTIFCEDNDDLIEGLVHEITEGCIIASIKIIDEDIFDRFILAKGRIPVPHIMTVYSIEGKYATKSKKLCKYMW